MNFYLAISILTLAISVLATLAFRRLSFYFKILDIPSGPKKIHSRPMPLLGGFAVFMAFFTVLFLFRDSLLVGNLTPAHWLGFFVGSSFLMIGGVLDDKYDLSPGKQIIWPFLAVLSVILGGVEVEKITNPISGGFIYLPWFVSAILIFAWLFGMMYTTKLQDGLDGLVTGIVSIGALMIAFFTMSEKYYQPDITLAALVLFFACLGFFIFNWHPASIFLGEGGSLFLGFALGVLAIISGGKIAIAFLVVGVPAMDVFWTIVRRLKEGKNPFRSADRKHLHHRLLDLGLSQRQAVSVFYFFAASFGLSALFLQSIGKLLAIMILGVLMISVVAGLNYLDKKKI